MNHVLNITLDLDSDSFRQDGDNKELNLVLSAVRDSILEELHQEPAEFADSQTHEVKWCGKVVGEWSIRKPTPEEREQFHCDATMNREQQAKRFAFLRKWERIGGKPREQMEAEGWTLTPCICSDDNCPGWKWELI